MAQKKKPSQAVDAPPQEEDEQSRGGGLIQIDVALEGITDIQFDRFVSMDGSDVRPEEKMYLRKDGSMYLPSANMLAFFYSKQYQSCIKMFVPMRQSGVVSQEAKALISVRPNEISFLRKGKPVVFSGFKKDEDKRADVYVHHDVARFKGGIPEPKARPTLRMPWRLEFELAVFEMQGRSISVSKVHRWLVDGGVLLGVGNHRPMFGKFRVAEFKIQG